MASGDTKTEALLNILGNGGDASEYKSCCNTKTQNYILDAIDRVQNVEDDVEELKNNPDVVDIVDTYADLQAYDTQHLSNNDIIRVLADETHSGNSTYYKFNKTAGTWTFIGEISGGGVNVVQTTGTSQTDVMSQDATTNMIYANNKSSVRINAGGLGFPQTETDSIQIGNGSTLSRYSITIGTGVVYNTQSYGVAVGYSANNTGGPYAVALGAYSSAWERGIVSVGDTSGTHQVLYKNTPYRKIVNVYDGENPHDAATIAQGNRLMTAAPTTSDVGVLGQLWTDTTGMHTYQCTAISGSTYTWTQRW